MYAYCLNNPASRIDAAGNFSYRVEESIDGYNLIVEEENTNITGKYSVTIVFELSYVEEITLYWGILDISMSKSGAEIVMPNGKTLAFSYSSTSLDFDSYSVPFLEGTASSHSFVFSEDGWGIESAIDSDGLNFSLTIQYKPNWLITTFERITSDLANQMTGLGDGAPRWKDSQSSAKLNFGGKVGCDMFSTTANMFR